MTPPVLVRPEELALIDLNRSAVVEASAGTGKTYLLEHLVLDILIRGRASLDQILVVTFTERATAELVTRIRRKIDQALAATEPGAVAGWTIDGTARQNLVAARRAFDRATIATIHSFCQGILTEEPLATRRLFGQTQMEARQIFGQAFRDVLRRTLTMDEGYRGYLEAFLAAGASVEGLERLLYGAATGRGRWKHTFDEHALDRALSLLARVDLEAPDFDKAARKLGVAKFVRKHVGELKAMAQATLAGGHRAALLGYLDRAKTLNGYFNKAVKEQDIAATLKGFQEFSEAIFQAAPPLEEAIAQRFLPAVIEEVDRRKLTEGLYDYDDMINGVDLALGGEGGAALIAKLRGRYRFALIDEAQDTEPAQWRIFKRVFLDSDAPHPVVLIGDPKQAIYGFRGADVHTYIEACRDIASRGGAPTVALTRNYRATPEVVAPLNAILEQQVFGTSFFCEGDIVYDQPVVATRPARGDGPGIWLLRVDPPAEQRKPRIGEIRGALRNAIAEEIVSLRAQATDLRLSEIAILARTNADGREVAARLRQDGIPSTLFRAEYLFESTEATDLRALLAAIADPEDPVARMKAWLTPFFGMDLAELAASAHPPVDHPMMARLLRWAALAEARAYARLWPAILDESGIARRLRLSPGGQRALTNYRHLLDRLQAMASARPVSIGELAALLAMLGAPGHRRTADTDDDTQRLETEADAVRIMTIHAAKGLEAEVVFVYGGLTGRRYWKNCINQLHSGDERLIVAGLPRSDEVIERVALTRRQEERRLQYVAMTRARRRLYLPFFPVTEFAEPPDSKEASDFDAFTAITGEYRHVNERLRRLDGEPARAGLFETRLIRLDLEGNGAATAAAAGKTRRASNAPSAPDGWVPPAELAVVPPSNAEEAAGLRARRRGFAITSYSRLKESAGVAVIPDDPGAFDVHEEIYEQIYEDVYNDGESVAAGPGGGAEAVAVGVLDAAERIEGDLPGRPASAAKPIDDSALPGGAASGLFLHGVLEKTPLGPLPPLGDWQRQPEVRLLIENELRRWDRDPRHFDAGAALVHAALTARLEMPGGARPLAGISEAARVRREVGFLFPLPASPSGFVRGFLDVLFEHDGRVWFADWKSDVMSGYGGDAVRARVREHYDLQVRIYTMATARLLGVSTRDDFEQRFGGVVYLFLRGLDGTGAGIYTDRPSYEDFKRWEADLAEMPVLGGSGAPL